LPVAYYGAEEGDPTGEFYTYAAAGNNPVHPNPISGDLSTTVYVCLPGDAWVGGPGPDGNVIRAGSSAALVLAGVANNLPVVDGAGASPGQTGLTFTYGAYGVKADSGFGPGFSASGRVAVTRNCSCWSERGAVC
jgi:hypothetical protein